MTRSLDKSLQRAMKVDAHIITNAEHMVLLMEDPSQLERVPLATRVVLGQLAEERMRQRVTWGEQHHPDGTSGHNFRRQADAARRSCQAAARGGYLTWLHILREEFWEAMAETEPDRLRYELLQAVAVGVAWIEDLDSRTAAAQAAVSHA